MRTDLRALLGARLARVARMALYGASVSIAVGIAAARRVHADVRETARASSSVLSQLADLPELAGGVTHLSLNGESVHVAAAVVRRPMADVVHAIEADCHADLPGLEAPPLVARAAPPMTANDGASTMILCLAETARTRERTLRGRLVAFMDSRDIADLGSLRHFVLAPVEGGTRVIAAWLPNRFLLDRAFPSEGDAPGSDAEGAPRPEAARRLLVAGVEGHAYVVRVYEVRGGSARTVAARYDHMLTASGWARHDGAGPIYALGDRDLVVQVHEDARLGSVFVSTIDMPAPGAAK